MGGSQLSVSCDSCLSVHVPLTGDPNVHLPYPLDMTDALSKDFVRHDLLAHAACTHPALVCLARTWLPAGMKVTVVGTLDNATNTVVVQSITINEQVRGDMCHVISCGASATSGAATASIQ